jgi:hypothetical protein
MSTPRAYSYFHGPGIDEEKAKLAAIPDAKKTEAQKARQKELDISDENYRKDIEHENRVEDDCIRRGVKYYRP